jgi:hypothetical protein
MQQVGTTGGTTGTTGRKLLPDSKNPKIAKIDKIRVKIAKLLPDTLSACLEVASITP